MVEKIFPGSEWISSNVTGNMSYDMMPDILLFKCGRMRLPRRKLSRRKKAKKTHTKYSLPVNADAPTGSSGF